MAVSSRGIAKIEIITGVRRRSRLTPEQKIAWVRRTTKPNMSVSAIAQEVGISTGSSCWRFTRCRYQEMRLEAVCKKSEVVLRYRCGRLGAQKFQSRRCYRKSIESLQRIRWPMPSQIGKCVMPFRSPWRIDWSAFDGCYLRGGNGHA